jgi:MFS family permease
MGIHMFVFFFCPFSLFLLYHSPSNAIAGGNTIGPLIYGFIVSNLSWCWHKCIVMILTALIFLAVIFFVLETRYECHNSSSSGASTPDEKTDMQTPRHLLEDSLPQVPKRTFAQDLALWSGVPLTNLYKMFSRYRLAVLASCYRH